MKQSLQNPNGLRIFFEEELSKFVTFLKVGTESEAMMLPFIAMLINLVRKEKVVCKIGGPDARTDIHEMYRIGILRFVGPMIESPFGVKKFIEAITKTVGLSSIEELTINVESITAFNQIDDILAASNDQIHRINVGFSDLAASVGGTVTDLELLRMAKELRNRCKIIGKEFSFGGTVTPENIEKRLEFLEPDGFETRMFGFSGTIANAAVVVKKALEFEAAVESYFAANQQRLVNASINRAASINKRLTSDFFTLVA